MFRPNRWLVAGLSACAIVALVMFSAGCSHPPKDTSTQTGTSVTGNGEKGSTVLLRDHKDAVPHSQHLSKKNKPDEDHVRWINQTGGRVQLHFDAGWPFLEPEADIIIDIGKSSAYYTLNPDTPGTAYTYKDLAAPNESGGGPGEPDITADP